MQRIGLSIVLAFFCFGSVFTGFGRPPDIRLPEWYKTCFSVKSWNPATGELRVVLTVEALLVPLRGLSAQAAWPTGFTFQSPKQSADQLAKGQTWAAEFVAKGPATFEGWMELSAEAMPDPAAMRRVIETTSSYSPTVKAILLEELRALDKPLAIGVYIPLHLDSRIAVSALGSFLPTPVWPAGGCALHLWLPEASLANPEAQKLGESWKLAVKEADPKRAITAAEALLAYFKGEEPVQLLPLNEPPVLMNPKLVKALLEASIEALKGLSAGQAALEGQIKALADRPPAFADAFRAANLGALMAMNGGHAKAFEAFRLALKLAPAWPLVKSWQKNLGRNK